MAQTINKCSHFNKKPLVSTEWLWRPGKRYIKQFCCVAQFHVKLSELARNSWLTYRHTRLPFATLNGASNWINRLSNSFLPLHLLLHEPRNYEECCFRNAHNHWVWERRFQSRVISIVSIVSVTANCWGKPYRAYLACFLLVQTDVSEGKLTKSHPNA